MLDYNMKNSSFKNISKIIKRSSFIFEVHTIDRNIYKLQMKERISEGKILYSMECHRLDQKNDEWLKVLVPTKECDTEQESLVLTLMWLNDGS